MKCRAGAGREEEEEAEAEGREGIGGTFEGETPGVTGGTPAPAVKPQARFFGMMPWSRRRARL